MRRAQSFRSDILYECESETITSSIDAVCATWDSFDACNPLRS
jgi:hypothetical protein